MPCALVRLVACLLVLCPILVAGCAYLDTAGIQAVYALRQLGGPQQRIYKHMLGRETYFVFGTIRHKPAQVRDRLAVVALSDRWRRGEVVDVNWFSRDDSYYGLNLPEGGYRLLVGHDADGDGWIQESETLGGRTLQIGPAVAPDRVLGDCDIDLSQRPQFAGTRFRVAVPPPVALTESVIYPRGTIRRLDDPLFSPAMANLGLYRPREFLERAPMMFYALEDDLAYKIPVVFVHGIGGSPRDFAPLVRRLDRSRYRAWFFYYPSGQDLSQLAAMFQRIFLSGTVIPLDRMPLVIVAHSMGGVLVREALNRQRGRPGETRVARLITIASPLGGHPGARFAKRAPVVIPSWRDLDPDGAFIRDLHRRPLPEDTRYQLVYTTGEGAGGRGHARNDGVVPLASQLTSRAQSEADELIGVAASHMGVLRDEAVINRILASLDGVRSPFPADHLGVLRRGGYDLPASIAGHYTPLESYLVRTTGRYLDALAAGKLHPIHPAQEHFVAYSRGETTAAYPAETAWTKLCADLPGRQRE